MKTPSARDDWDQLVDRYFQSTARFEPILRLRKSWEKGETVFPPMEDDYFHAQRTLIEMMISSIDEFPEGELDKNRQFQRNFILKRLKQQLFQMMEGHDRSDNPLLYLPYSQLIQLVSYPMKEFADVLDNSLQAIPDNLRIAKTFFKNAQGISDIYLLAAIEEIKQNQNWLKNIPELAIVKKYIGNPKRLRPVIDEVIVALKEFGVFLQTECISLVVKKATTLKQTLLSNVTDLYELEKQLLEQAPQKVVDIKPISIIQKKQNSRLIECGALSIFNSFSCYMADKKTENILTPTIYVEQIVRSNKQANDWLDSYREKLTVQLPIKDEHSLIWHSFKKFSAALVYVKQHKLLSEHRQSELENYLNLLAYLDYQTNWQKQQIESLIEEYSEETNIENLIILVLKSPGFYWASQQILEQKNT